MEGVNASAWFFMEARQDFFAATSGETVALVPRDMEVVRPGQDRGLCHTVGLPFAEHEVGGWFEVMPSTGQLRARFPDAEVRGDLGFAVLGHRANKGAGDTESRRGIWDFMGVAQEQAAEPSSFVPGFEHAVKVTPTGLRDKLQVFKDDLGHLSPEQATEHLKQTVASALDRGPHRQYYYEEVECCLKLGASPMETARGQSLLECVLRNANLNESIATRSAELLCGSFRRAGHPLSQEERGLLQGRADDDELSARFRKRWSALLERSARTS